MSVLYPLRRVFGIGELLLNKNYSVNNVKKIDSVTGIIKTKSKRYERDNSFAKPKMSSVLNELDDSGDFEEPGKHTFDAAYVEYQRESRALEFKMKRKKMMHKHFKEYIPKEISLLTYAEKEHIRYLHNSDSEAWNPDTISDAFPVSREGVQKLIKSTFRIRSYEEAIAHDKEVSKKIQMIKEGLIKLTPELKRKMELRDKIPLNLGAAAQQYYQSGNATALSVQRQKPLGEFESLVSLPITSGSVVKYNSNDIEPYPYSPPHPRKEDHESDEEQELFTQLNKKKSREFDKLNISRNKVITLDELETQLKSKTKNNEIPMTSDQELKYLISLDDKSLLNKKPSKESCDMWTEDDYHPRTLLQKFNNSPDDDENVQNFEEIQQTVPVFEANSASRDRINVPPGLKKPGAIYKVGDSYYDEEGEFMYRVV